MSVDPRTPCVIGVGQRTWRAADPSDQAPEPLAMWDEVVRTAADDAGAAPGARAVLDRVGSLRVIYSQSWQYDDPPGRLAERLGIDPAHRTYTGVSGTMPLLQLGEAANAMARGELDAAVVVGAEALDTRRRLKKLDRRPEWSHKDPERKPFPLEAPFLDTEIAHEVFQAWLTFACWDVGRRAARGVAPDDYRTAIGELLAPMTRVAAANPDAWFPVERTPAELITPGPDNRMVGYPYTKYVVSVMDVDMAAAVVLATHETADALGVPPERRVYLRGWSYLVGPTYLAEHESYGDVPAMRQAAHLALDRAGTTIDDVAHLDLYSCFHSSIAMARDGLNLADDDPRGITVTGGLPYFGGPGSNYLSHSIGRMVELLRADPGALGLTSGVGMHMTKHAYAVWSTTPGPLGEVDDSADQAFLDAQAVREIVPNAQGTATVATYSVVHGRDGDPAWALLICDLPDGARCYAKALEPGLLAALEADEWVGRQVTLVDAGGGVHEARAE